MPEVRLFWTGPPLSPYEQLSLRSFIASGARVLLYSTLKTLRVPDGVELMDAREILSGPVHRFAFPDGDRSAALHSDLFRYAAVGRHGGWYADLDIVCVGGRLPPGKVYIARERDHLVNGAIMKFPAQSPFVTAALEEAWKLLPNAGPGAPLSARESIGPKLVTRLANEYALDHLIRPRSSAYAIGVQEIPAMFDPRRREELDERTAGSDFVHLWNEYLRRLRIPKDLGPPAGSFLDGLFARFGFSFDDEARLSADAVAAWFEEGQFLVRVRRHLGIPFVSSNALTTLIGRGGIEAARPAGAAAPKSAEAFGPAESGSARETVRTFWASGEIGPYQLVCLKSFADRGHRVEVFTFDKPVNAPIWIDWQNAADILPIHEALRGGPERGQTIIDAGLFRHALLHRHGGWWIDPDLVLLRSDLPNREMFFASFRDTPLVSSAAMKLPAGHPVMTDVLMQSALVDQGVEQGEEGGAPLLATCITAHGLFDECEPIELVSPISRLEVEILFDPERADLLADKLQNGTFFDLHQDIWLRAGIPREIGPPPGSWLDRLFRRHDIGSPFAARMDYGDLRRWLFHMYNCLGH